MYGSNSDIRQLRMNINIKREADESTFDGQSKKLKAGEGGHKKLFCTKCPGKSWLTKSGVAYHMKTKHDIKEASSSQEVSAEPVVVKESNKSSDENMEPNKTVEQMLKTTGPLNPNQINATQNESYNEQLSKVLEENRRMAVELAAVAGEAAELRARAGAAGRLMAELRGMVECPVCLLLPKARPVPMCPNGHHVCVPCRERLALEERVVRCPTCKVPLGVASSLLAARVMEVVEHECEHVGCPALVPLAAYPAHLAACTLRLVLCPGFRCEELVATTRLGEHVAACRENMEWKAADRGKVFKSPDEKDVSWKTRQIIFNGRMFFFHIQRSGGTMAAEVVMLGSGEECENYIAEISLLGGGSKTVAKFSNAPRPMDKEKWGDFCFTVSQKAMDKIWKFDPAEKKFKFEIKVRIIELGAGIDCDSTV